MKKRYLHLIITILSLFYTTAAFSATEDPYYAAYVQPNVLIILDRSGSMARDVAGNNTNTPCPAPEYPSSLDANVTTYSRICIARHVLFDLLDANNSNSITDPPAATADQTSLGVRLGYARFIDVGSTTTGAGEGTPTYNDGSIRVIYGIDTSYSTLWGTTTGDDINSTDTGGRTPLGTALSEAYDYFHSSNITGEACYVGGCRKNYVILVTDGADTITCDSDTGGTAANRRATVWAARKLRNGDGNANTNDENNVFVVGFGGDLPVELQYTLNWAAYYGGTNNPNENDTTPFPSDPFTWNTNSPSICNAGTGDPSGAPLSGYAFLATDATSLATSIKKAIDIARTGSYTRSQPVITASGNKIYTGFFDLPGWKGHLDTWEVDNNPLNATYGQILPGSENACTSGTGIGYTDTPYLGELYDAGVALTNSGCIAGYVAPDARKIWTVVNTVPNSLLTEFQVSSTTSTPADQVSLCTDLIKTSPATCTSAEATSTALGSANELINFIRFSSATFNNNGGTRDNSWRLGDIWHSTPAIVGPPQGTFNSTAYKDFKSYYSSRKQVLIVGGNDGMLHAFSDSDIDKGKEMWSFIPRNLLGTLKDLNAGHALFVDASPTAADVCLAANCGAYTDWKTVVITGERDGGNGYFALDITDTTNPLYKWQFSDPDYLGNTWSKPAIGKVRYDDGTNIVDKWVTFFGGGYSTADVVGNYVYAVDIADGTLLSRKQVNSTNTSNDVPSALRPVDLNGDYYVDAIYFGGTDGKLYKQDVTNNNPTNWSVSPIFDPATSHDAISCPDLTITSHNGHTSRAIYYAPAVAYDADFNLYVAFGTGYVDDYTDPKGSTTEDYFYMIKIDKTSVREIFRKDFTNGERVVAAPVVYGGYVWYVTYLPSAASTCCDAGKGYLRWVEIAECGISGSVEIGSGIPQGPVFLNGKPYTDTSNNPKPDNPCDKVGANCPTPKGTGAEVIYWRER